MGQQEELERKMGLRRRPANTRASSNCIFCKQPSHSSKSVEHIIPESLGNSRHILPVGVVCDKCNNYFARKIEGPLLETTHFKNLRSRQRIPNKRGKIPYTHGLLLGVDREIQMDFIDSNYMGLAALYKKDEPAIKNHLMETGTATFFIPQSVPFDQYILSRFLAKAALEILAHRFYIFEDWEAQVVRAELDQIRNYARYGSSVEYWPFYQRQIYDENRIFEEEGVIRQTLHEFDLLYTAQGELYAVICILGTEYTINLVGPELEGYEIWLRKNSFASFLHSDKTKCAFIASGQGIE